MKSVLGNIGRCRMYVLAIAAGVVLGLAAVCVLVRPIWDDQAWLLYAAGQMMHGERLYIDILETNPPLMIWISAVPVALAQVIGATPITSLVFFVVSLSIGISAWCVCLYSGTRQEWSDHFVPWLAIALIYMTIVHPSMTFHGEIRKDFAQREHFIVLLLLPYLFAVARRLDGRHLSTRQSIFVGLAAAIALCLKPHYIIVVAGVEALLLFRRQRSSLLVRPELIVLAIGGVSYCALVWLVTPDYFTKTIPLLSSLYGSYEPTSFRVLVLSYESLIFRELTAVAWLLALRLVLHRAPRAQSVVLTLLVAGATAFVAYIVQGKEWTDHVLPAEIFTYLALSLLALDQIVGWVDRLAAPLSMGRVAATTAMLAGCLVAMVAYLPMRRAKLADTSAQQELEGLNRATAHLPAGTPVWAMAPGIELQFYFVLTRGLVWASRSPCLWLQAAIARAELSRGGAPPEHIGSYRESLLALVREDLQRWQPPVMLVLRCADVGCRKRLDLPKWFILHDPAFAAIWSHYTLVERIGRFDLYSNENSAQ